jgi:DNA-binding response OmpR family regulator
MENWILVVGYDRDAFGAAQREWLKYNVLLHMVDTLAEAIGQLARRNYLAVAVSAATPDLSPPIQIMRGIRPIPIVILTPEDRAMLRAETLLSDADEFIDPSRIKEGVEKGRAVIERYRKLPLQEGSSANVLSHKEIFMAVDFHKVFFRGKEIPLSKNEMAVLRLLLTQTGRVFEYEQIYYHIYGEDGPAEYVVNAVHCHIKRIRRKFKTESCEHNYITAVRGVGYRIEAS